MVTVDNIKDHLGRTDLAFTVGDTAVVQRFIDGVSTQAEGYCNRYFRSGTMTERIENYGTRFIKPRGYPIISVSEVKFVPTGRVYGASEIELDAENIYRVSDRIWPKGKYDLTYAYGWATADVPDDLKLAIINEVISNYNLQRAVPRPTENISAWERETELSSRFLKILEPYIRC